MSLQMRITPTYGFPGSIIKGCIISRLKHGMHFTARSLTVTLLGRSTTRVSSQSTAGNAIYEGSENFLKIGQTLNEQVPVISNDLDDGQRPHFHIQFPEDATFSDSRANTARWPRILNLQAAQNLPPTGDFGNGNIIEHSVEAGVLDQTSSDKIMNSIPIEFSLAREDVVSDPEQITVVQTSLLTDQSQDLNYCSIRLALDGPTMIAQDNSFPLVLRLRNITEHRPSPRATVSLRSGFIEVLQRTMAWTNVDYGKRWTDVHTIVSRDFSSNDGAPQITTEGTDLAALFHNPSISRSIPPSFKCANIERTYGLKVCLTIGIKEHECKFSFDINLVTVFPGELHCMAVARQQDELWENPLEDRPFPDAVSKLWQSLGV